MKFLKLTIEGITSIKSKIIIDFKKDLFNEDLFAITGQTGSGKSSILNAISLALYNTGHKKINAEEYVSLGSEKGYISLDFSINTVVFNASWECRMTSKSGKSIKPVINNTLRREGHFIDKNAEEVIGLNAKQFFKTIIINQGKFNEFLSAPFKDRKILLEQIYGTDNLSGLSTFIKRKVKELECEKVLIESKMEGSIPFSEKIYNEKSQNIKELKAKHEALKKMILPFSQLKQQIEETSKYLVNINKDQTIINQLNTQFDDIKINYNNLLKIYNESETNYKRLIKKSKEDLPMLKRIDSLNIKSNEFNNKNIFLKEEIKSISEKIISASTEIKQQENRHKALTEELASSPPSLLDKLSKEEVSVIQDIINKLNSKITKSQLYKETLIAKEKLLSEIESRGKGYRLNHDQLLLRLNIKETSEFTAKNKLLIDTEEKLLSQENECQIKFIHVDQRLSKFLEKNELLQKNRDQIKTYQLEINKQILSQNIIEQEIKIIIKSEELSSLHESIIRCKIKAYQDSQCPICDNVDLKDLSKISLEKKSSASILNDENKKSLKKKEKQLIENINNIKNIDTEISELKKKNIELSEDIGQYLILINKEFSNGMTKKLCIEDVKEFIRSKQEDSLFIIKKQIKETKDLIRSELKDHQELIEINNSLKNSKAEYKILHVECVNLKLQLDRNSIEIKGLKDKISTFLNSTKLPDQFIKNFESLRNELSNRNECVKNIEQNTTAKTNLQNHINTYKVDHEKIKNKISKNNESNTLLTVEIAKTLKMTAFNSAKKGLDFYEEEINKSRKVLDSDKSLYFEISNKRDVLSSNLNIKKENIVQQKLECTKLQSMITMFDYKLYYIDSELYNNFQKFGIKIKDRNFLEFSFEDENYLSSALNTIIIPLQDKLITDAENTRDLIVLLRIETNQYKEKIKSLTQLNHLEEKLSYKLNRQKNLLEALGKDDFGRFAASLIEQQLIQLCNKEMEALCEARYEILQLERNKTNGPEFFVIDHWREAQLRNISTLSGGETFLVSLAMALGLAEMTRGKVEIESFFIDEGFGTLDEDSIEEVLNILLTIRSRGKQIGIISHITSLTDRIPVRICLEKDQWGESTLNISQN
jgi:DNA repair protein SbcC/Rad50